MFGWLKSKLTASPIQQSLSIVDALTLKIDSDRIKNTEFQPALEISVSESLSETIGASQVNSTQATSEKSNQITSKPETLNLNDEKIRSVRDIGGIPDQIKFGIPQEHNCVEPSCHMHVLQISPLKQANDELTLMEALKIGNQEITWHEALQFLPQDQTLSEVQPPQRDFIKSPTLEAKPSNLTDFSSQIASRELSPGHQSPPRSLSFFSIIPARILDISPSVTLPFRQEASQWRSNSMKLSDSKGEATRPVYQQKSLSLKLSRPRDRKHRTAPSTPPGHFCRTIFIYNMII
jgi:hypothetical protein